MRDLAGRVLVAVPLLVAVLAAAYFDDWWLFAVAAVGAILALHELYTTIRPLRPLVLAGRVERRATCSQHDMTERDRRSPALE